MRIGLVAPGERAEEGFNFRCEHGDLPSISLRFQILALRKLVIEAREIGENPPMVGRDLGAWGE